MSNISPASKDHGAAQANPGLPQPKRGVSPAVIAGIGGTITALVVVGAIMATKTAPAPVDAVPAPATQSSVATIQSPATVAPGSAVAPDRSNQCEMPSLALQIWGQGSVRIHSGSYVSPPIQLNSDFQRVTFPMPGPSQAGQGAIIVESTVGFFYFKKVENDPAGTALVDADRTQRIYPFNLNSPRQVSIAVGWNPRKPC